MSTETSEDTAVDAVAALQAAVRCRTVSDRDSRVVDVDEFENLLEVLTDRFPLLHATAEIIGLSRAGIGMGQLMRWRGTDSQLSPVVLMAHLDVVPVEPTDTWTYPAFDGVLEDGIVWGRGTLDCKGSLIALCAAAERLLAQGFQPQRDIWFSFGCDEEVAGPSAEQAVAELERRKVDPWFVLDEGGAIALQAFPGLDRPLGVIGIGEKGALDLRLSTTDDGGHSSTPVRNGATARLAKAIVALDRSPFPPSLPDATVQMLEQVSAKLSGPLGLALRAATKSKHLLARALIAAGPETAAMARTTTAVTQLFGSPGANIIATTASAVVNLRIMVGESVASAIERVRKIIGDDSVAIEVLSASEPSSLAPTDDAFDLIAGTISSQMPDVLAAPYVVMAATDARFFQRRWPRVYRFNPFRMTKAQRATLHNADEHIRVDDFLEGIDWYAALIGQL